jgi:hypothetical protein
MKKRFFSFLLCLCMAVILLPLAALAEDPVPYDLWVNNEQITSAHLTVTCGAGTAVYDPASNTLTLNGAEITQGCLVESLYSGIVSRIDGLTVSVASDSSITNTGGEGISTFHQDGSYNLIPHDLTVTGSGKLTISQDTAYYGYGIYCTGSLTIDGADLDITAASSGLWANQNMTINNSTVKTTAVAVTAQVMGQPAEISGYGMVTNTGTITLTGSTVTAASAKMAAILLGNDVDQGALVINSGTLVLNGVQGICSDSSGSTVTVNGGGIGITATDVAVTSNYVSITYSNSTSVTSGSADGKSFAINKGIVFTSQPVDPAGLAEGSITASLTAAASVLPSGTATLNWYACDGTGTILSASLGTGSTFRVPTSLTNGVYYFLCQASAPSETAVNSSIATVAVAPGAPEPYELPVSTIETQADGNYILRDGITAGFIPNVPVTLGTLDAAGNGDGVKIDYYWPMQAQPGYDPQTILDRGYTKLVEYNIQIPLSNYAGSTLSGAITFPLPSGFDGGSAVIVGGTAAESHTSSTVTFPITLDVSNGIASKLGLTIEYKPADVTYAVTVNSGSGSSRYAAGAVVTIAANAAPDGTHFAHWNLISGAGVTLANANAANTTFTMPASDVTLEALYASHAPDGTGWKTDAESHWHVCSCGTVLDKAGHTYGSWSVTKTATATEDGSKVRICTVCGYRDVASISRTGTSSSTSSSKTSSAVSASSVPQTGDSSQPIIWVVLICLSAGALAVFLVTLSKKRGSKQ